MQYQVFSYPEYPQYRQDKFVSYLTALELLFQCGFDGARVIFYSNMKKEEIR